MRNCRLGHSNVGDQIGVDDLLDLRHGGVFEAGASPLNGGIEHDDVEPAQVCHGGADDLFGGAVLGQVLSIGHTLPAGLANEAQGRLGVVVLLGQMHNRHVCTLAGVGSCHCAADTRVTAGDQSLLAPQPGCAHIALLPMVGGGVSLRGVAGLTDVLVGGHIVVVVFAAWILLCLLRHDTPSGRGSAVRTNDSRVEDDFDAAVLLLLEHAVRLWSLLKRHPVGDEIVDAQRI